MTISKETVEEMKLATKADKPTEIKYWNIQDRLTTNEERANYLEAALEENNKDFIAIALCDIAESLGIGFEKIVATAIMKRAEAKITDEVLKSVVQN